MRASGRTRPRGENNSYWTSYSDMMAGLMLVFALVMFFSIHQFAELQQTRQQELTDWESQLTAQQQQLALSQTLLTENEAELTLTRGQLETQATALSTKETELSNAELELSNAQLELANAQLQLALSLTELDKRDLALLAAQASVETQQTQLTAQEALLVSQREYMALQQRRIDDMIGVRSRIIADLRDELARAQLDVVVDAQTGAITLKGAVLFDVNSAELKQSGRELLNNFIPVYVRTLLDPANREYVGEIIIEGHTDTTGNFLSNLDLSQRRAFTVAQYCLQDGFGSLTGQERTMLRTIMTANGRSWSNPVYQADGLTVNMEASRRVEFKFRLKDAEMINEMNAIMEGSRDTSVD